VVVFLNGNICKVSVLGSKRNGIQVTQIRLEHGAPPFGRRQLAQCLRVNLLLSNTKTGTKKDKKEKLNVPFQDVLRLGSKTTVSP
jgi:hypothetical protein